MTDSLQFVSFIAIVLYVIFLEVKIWHLKKRIGKPKYAVGDKVKIKSGEECVIHDVVDTTGDDVLDPTRWVYTVFGENWYADHVLESSLKRAD
jgi:hypothetical protein